MRRLLFRKLMSVAVVLPAVMLCCFAIIRNAPGDAVANYLGRTGDDPVRASTGPDLEYRLAAERLGVHLPAFYVSVAPPRWHGTACHFHVWLRNYATGQQVSYRDHRSIGAHLADAFPLTLVLGFCSLLLAFGASLPLGVWLFQNRERRRARVVQWVLFGLYTLPTFWVATLVITWVVNRTGYFIGMPPVLPGRSVWGHVLVHLPTLVVPILCLSYHQIAYLSRQLYSTMSDEAAQDYVTTARAKGLSEKEVARKHIFRNALTPMIAAFGQYFPQMLAGSVFIEYIFNLHGMGSLLVESVGRQDWPVVTGIVMLAAAFSVVGNILADLIHAHMDRRVTAP